MTGLLYRVGRLCGRHHWPVIAIWVVAAVALALVSRAAGEQTSDNLSLPGTGSTRALDLLQDKLPQQANGSNPVVLKVAKGTLDDSARPGPAAHEHRGRRVLRGRPAAPEPAPANPS